MKISFFQESAAIADKASIPDKLQTFRKVHDVSNAPRLLDGEEGDELKEKVEKIEWEFNLMGSASIEYLVFLGKCIQKLYLNKYISTKE